MHTPGPWTIHQDGNRDKYICGSPDARWPRVCTVTRATEESDNARLIAAAPELLAACKALEERLASLDWEAYGVGMDGSEKEVCNQARAAIAKATA